MQYSFQNLFVYLNEYFSEMYPHVTWSINEVYSLHIHMRKGVTTVCEFYMHCLHLYNESFKTEAAYIQ